MSEPVPNKEAVRAAVIEALEAELAVARQAADQARETATHEDSVAENQYDTFGLEASYLAEGHSKRIEGLKMALADYRRLSLRNFEHGPRPGLGALVTLENRAGRCRWFFIGPSAGGLRVVVDGVEVLVISPGSPLGVSMLGSEVGEALELKGESMEIVRLA